MSGWQHAVRDGDLRGQYAYCGVGLIASVAVWTGARSATGCSGTNGGTSFCFGAEFNVLRFGRGFSRSRLASSRQRDSNYQSRRPLASHNRRIVIPFLHCHWVVCRLSPALSRSRRTFLLAMAHSVRYPNVRVSREWRHAVQEVD